MNHKGYTLAYFINFFSSIPTAKVVSTNTTPSKGRGCAGTLALGNPGRPAVGRLAALDNFLGGPANTDAINDGRNGFNKLGKTPRTRILAALRNRKRTGNPMGTK